MSIITYPLNSIEYTALDAETYLSTRTSGVFSADIAMTPKNMTVTVGAFLAWINNKSFSGKSVAVTEPVTLDIDRSEAVLNRIDRIVLRFNAIQNSSSLVVLKGSSSSTPIAPAISRSEAVYDLCLCEVTVKAGTTELTNAEIKSTLLDENLCGIMRDGVTGIPTAQLQSQAEALILRLHEVINDVEADAACMLRDLYDPQDKAKPVAFDDEVLKNTGGEVTGNIKNTNKTSFAAIQKERETNGKVYSVAVGSGLGQSSVTGAIEVAEATSGSYNIIARLDVGQEGVKYRGASEKSAILFGEHNKPTGTYVGNGKERRIYVGGIGSVLYIYSDDATYQALITPKTGFGWLFPLYSDGTVVELFYSDAYFDGGGYLNVENSNSLINLSGETYHYVLL